MVVVWVCLNRIECFISNFVFSRNCLCIPEVVSPREEAEELSVVFMFDAIPCDWAKIFCLFVFLLAVAAVPSKADAMSVTNLSCILNSTAIARPYSTSWIRSADNAVILAKAQVFGSVLTTCHYSFSFYFPDIGYVISCYYRFSVSITLW